MEGQDHGHDHGTEGACCGGGKCDSEEMDYSFGPFQGSPKTMFFLGLFAGIAACTTIALLLIVSSVASGKGILSGLGSAKSADTAAAAAPTAAAPTAAAPTAAAPTPAAGPVKPVDEKTDHITGAKNGKVTLIEYSDFECPFCKRHFATMQQIIKDYPNDVRVIYRHFPLSFHQNAEKEAEASECVAALGGNDAFWKFHDKVFTDTTSNGTGFALTALGPAAASFGVDQKKFQDCLDSGKMAARVNQDQQEGGAAGVEGTPATFVNGELVSGAVPYATFKAKIDALLKK
jgi:protein-disulfide isomerase